MRKRILQKLWLLAILCMVGVTSAWGEVVYTLNCPKNAGNSSYTTYNDVTVSGITWNAPGNQLNDGEWRIGFSKKTDTDDRYVYSKTAIGENISSIVVSYGNSQYITVNSVKLDVYSTADLAAAGGTGDISSISGSHTANGTCTYDRPSETDWTGRYYRFNWNLTGTSTSKANFITLASITFNKVSAKNLTSISLNNQSTNYYQNDPFNFDGICTAHYDDSSSETVTPTSVSSPDMTTTGEKEITVSYTEKEITKEAKYNITVTALPANSFTWNLSIDQTTTATDNDLSWDNAACTINNNIGEGTTKPNNYYPGVGNTSTRVYTNNVFTITPKSGYNIKRLEFDATTTGFATTFAAPTWTNAKCVASGTKVYLTPIDGTQAISAKLSGQSGFTSIKIYYEGEAFNSQVVNITSAGWATACIPFKSTISGATAYKVSVDGGNLTKNELDVIPANEGILLKSSGGAAVVVFTGTDATPSDVTGNMMKGTTDDGGVIFCEASNTYYILSKKDDKVGFYWDPQGKTDTDYENGKAADCEQYKAVLAVPTSPAKVEGFSLEDEATSINIIDNSQCTMQNSQLYNLQGVCVNDSYKGIVISNGKKYILK